MTVKRGDVVLIQFPFASGRGSKLRPALVVQSDRGNARMANTIVVQITTNLRRVNEPTQLLIDPATPDGQSSGHVSPSSVECENIVTIEQSRIMRRIGRLRDNLEVSDRFPASKRAKRPKDRRVDRIVDESYGSIAHHKLSASRMLATKSSAVIRRRIRGSSSRKRPTLIRCRLSHCECIAFAIVHFGEIGGLGE